MNKDSKTNVSYIMYKTNLIFEAVVFMTGGGRGKLNLVTMQQSKERRRFIMKVGIAVVNYTLANLLGRIIFEVVG